MKTLADRLNVSGRRASILGACAGLVVVGAALAQSAPEARKRGGAFDKPLGVVAAPQGGGGVSESTFIGTSEDDGTTYTVRVHNNEVSAEVDGKPVPPERLERKGDTVIIKGEDGKVLKKFDVAMKGGATHAFSWAPGANAGTWTLSPRSVVTQTEPANPPPVMVGVTMSGVDSDLAEHLGLDEDTAFVIDHVVPDLPAAKAGVKSKDVVVAINGDRPATQEKLRETLRSKKAGDTLELTLLRKGKEQKVRLELVAYDQSKLTPQASGGDAFGAPMTPSAPGTFYWGAAGSDEARKAIEEALKTLQSQDAGKADKSRRVAEEALKKAMDSLKQSHDQMSEWKKAMGDQHDTLMYNFTPGQGFSAAGPADREMAKRLEKLSAQLDRLDKRLDDMERRLNDKNR